MKFMIRARVTHGLLEPLEPMELVEGEEVFITVRTAARPKGDGIRRSAGKWKDLVDADTLIRETYERRLQPTRPFRSHDRRL